MMRLKDSDTGTPVTVSETGEQRYYPVSKVFRLDELADIDPAKLPHRAVARATDYEGGVCYEPLEPADPPNAHLYDYRREAVQQILSRARQKAHRGTIVYGLSTLGKTETVFYKDHNFPPSETVFGQGEAFYFDLHGLYGQTAEEFATPIMESQREEGGKSDLAILDEFDPKNIEHLRLVEMLTNQDYKIVAAQGGSQSNQAKERSFQEASHNLPILADFDSIHLGIKPLNSVQLGEILQRNPMIRKRVDFCEQLTALSERLPIPYKFAKDIASVAQQPTIDEAGIKKALQTPNCGSVFLLEDLKREQTA